ncbi:MULTISPECIES: hypothetical protein [Psychrilyobacter]|uniref:ParB/Sulfiredoxin domain-containing protein n=1 Tax=Psychrilyobacter piezotolerans TaxID=2293438 RepID=A0ABX9KJ85_9FUSO|nr:MULTISPECIES: hypothetical protein [Psychrilyobacter]MCS5421873.1 hypothetical protein [Psychrilyobacter sp. S5]NDI76972.1 hypothetical protein [Psychrilyobacter piezotolerans]RDE64589.1 hypothetical protein DV867_03350 [Psychrilyobacter sp. S5]REI42401.1 hypothetical protein DYH56_03350 [Psychrilyobacter piezotolerans]
MKNKILLDVDKIGLDFRNPRLEESQSEFESLKSMLKNQKDKIYPLALDILERGLNPSENIITTKKNGKYIVLEGNRRITSLKLLKNPKLIENIDINLFKRFTRLHKKFMENPIEKIECINFENEKDALYWIDLKHTGENKGKGVVSWTTQQQQLFQGRYKNETSKEINVLKLLEKYGTFNESYKNKLGNIPLTNLNRLLSDPDIREVIGINFKNNNLFLKEDKKIEKTIEYLEEIGKDLMDKKIKVGDIYTKEKRVDYISKVSSRIKEKDSSGENRQSVQNPLVKNNQIILDENEKKAIELNDSNKKVPPVENNLEIFSKKTKSYPTTKARKYLMPITFRLKIESQRINNIFRELKTIEIDKYPNSVGILFRVFLELTLDWIIDKKKLTGHSDIKLVKKLEVVRNYMRENKLMDREELKIINTVISTKDHLFSITTLNNYIHNKSHSPTSNDLKTHWDNFEIFIEKIWDAVEEKSQ